MVHKCSNGGAVAAVVIGLSAGSVLLAQQSNALPVRQLGRRLAVSTDTLGNIFGIRQLGDGRVIVNDIGKHRILLFDSTLGHVAVIADSTASTKKAYGPARGGILAFRNDTTLFVDPVALSILVIDSHGTIVRTVAPPRPDDAATLVLPIGGAAVDVSGRLVYRGVKARCGVSGVCASSGGSHPAPLDTLATGRAAAPSYAMHDSSAILRADLATKSIDTVGFIAVPFGERNLKMVNNPDGTVSVTFVVPGPIVIADDWAVVSDGSVAFVRGLDYHIDWVSPDGTRSSTPKIAHDWHRLSDSEKTATLDSAKRDADSAEQARVKHQADSATKANGRPSSGHQMANTYIWPEPAGLPDYRPAVLRPASPLQPGPVRADADNNLWIRQATALPAGPAVYDIVNRQGKLIDRVELPPQMTLAGFGPGVVYLTVREGAGMVIAKYRIR